jgi:hypothetical protein
MFTASDIDREPGARTAWWSSWVSSQSSGPRSLAVGLAAQALPSFQQPEVSLPLRDWTDFVSKVLCSVHSADARSEFRAQEARVCCLEATRLPERGDRKTHHGRWWIEEMTGGQHRTDERNGAEQLRVTQMNSGPRNRRNSCADEKVYSIRTMSTGKNSCNRRPR